MKKISFVFLGVLLLVSCGTNKKPQPSWVNEPFSFMGIEIGSPISCIDSLVENPQIRSFAYKKEKSSSRWFETRLETKVAVFMTTLVNGNNRKFDALVSIYSYKGKISKIHLYTESDGFGVEKLYDDKYGKEYVSSERDEQLWNTTSTDPSYKFWTNSLNQRLYYGSVNKDYYLDGLSFNVHYVDVIYADLAVFDEIKEIRNKKEQKQSEKEERKLRKNAEIKKQQDI